MEGKRPAQSESPISVPQGDRCVRPQGGGNTPSQGDSYKQGLGLAGEDYALKVLTEAHLVVLVRNYRCARGEIDLIAQDGERIVFIEVRGRSSGRLGWGEESVTGNKMRRLRAVANYYLLAQGYRDYPPVRFDVLALRWQKGTAVPEVNWLKGVF
ncbi:Restriction endonuclease type II-like [Acididesulfobacillus acetoxydans]|uniref:UPF0102 protein DEACI_3350 n=1 Tax=Acididesulfobacillus acetoxydans TaxID=1561005 RepID=A0A8S0X0M8_9FIRM|nr:YraN family protein [Acididesulfobacillus acetoxydans]CAA7602671.1 Restriction endonuclease type II-like [Acididesulfobacillus acetoxydans]CEJ09144.1 UPF0102 protein YraN [yraN] [Acididesulfobacillus acetoxydans]